jgi:ABC-type sulfate transport system permease subunit
LAAARLQLVRGRPAILARVHPVLELRFGLAARWLARPQAFDGRGALVADLADAWAVEPQVGAGVGAVFRWTDAVEVGALITGFADTRARIAAGLAVEISWRSYDLF